jgi:type I restriction enzyme S subunit
MSESFKKLGEVADIETGFPFKSSDFTEIGVPVIRMSDLTQGSVDLSGAAKVKTSALEGLKKFRLIRGDFLFGLSGSLDAYGVHDSDAEAYLNQRVGRLQALESEPSNYSYLSHVLSSDVYRSYAYRVASGIAQLNISPNQVRDLPIFYPSLPEQQKISQILDTLDTQIQKTEALIAKLEKIKEGLLHDLLTRGIDQNGQLRPTPEQAPELYKESALGLIPKEWGLAHVSEIGAVITGSTPPSSDLNAWGGVHRFFTPADVKDSEPLDHTERTISDSGTRYVRLIPAEATLVVCIGSTIGKVGITSCPGATNQQINAVIPSNLWSPTFVFQAIRQHVYQIHAWAGLQAVPIVNKSTFQKMLIPKPSGQEQCRISDAVKKLEARATMERAIFEKLNKQKIALTDDLLTGRVRVTPLLPSS